MKIFLTALALTIALPAAAQKAPAPAPEKKECCCKKMSETANGKGAADAKPMGQSDSHAVHDMKKN